MHVVRNALEQRTHAACGFSPDPAKIVVVDERTNQLLAAD